MPTHSEAILDSGGKRSATPLFGLQKFRENSIDCCACESAVAADALPAQSKT